MEKYKTSTCFLIAGYASMFLAPIIATTRLGLVAIIGFASIWILSGLVYRIAEAIENRK